MMRAAERRQINDAPDVLDDPATKLAGSRPPAHPVLGGGQSPKAIARIERLVDFWRTRCDWQPRTSGSLRTDHANRSRTARSSPPPYCPASSRASAIEDEEVK
jgi:hypothetical protein